MAASRLTDAEQDYLRDLDMRLTTLVYAGATRRVAAHLLMDDQVTSQLGPALTEAGLGRIPGVTMEIAVERLDIFAPELARAQRTVFRTQRNAHEVRDALAAVAPPDRLAPFHEAVLRAINAVTRVWDMETDGFRAPMEGRRDRDGAADREIAAEAEQDWAAILPAVDAYEDALAREIWSFVSTPVRQAIAERFLKVPTEWDLAMARAATFPLTVEPQWQQLDPRELADTVWRHNRPDSRPEPAEPTRADRDVWDLVTVRDRPHDWVATPLPLFSDMMLLQLLDFASDRDDLTEAVPPALTEGWEVACMRLPWPERRRISRAVADSLPNGDENALRGLLPITANETVTAVLADAVLDLALLLPGQSDQPLGTALGLVTKQMATFAGQPVRAGNHVAGLLMLGDHRLPDLIDGWWQGMDGTAKIAAWRFWPDAIFAGAVEYALRWLEDPNEMELGAPASFLWQIPDLPGLPREVLEVEWNLPADNTPGPDGTSRRRRDYRVLRRWSVEEYGRLIAPRLRAVSSREGDPEPLLLVMQAWGITP